MVENSNRLPSGARETDSPRRVTETTRKKVPSQASEPAMPPSLRATSETPSSMGRVAPVGGT